MRQILCALAAILSVMPGAALSQEAPVRKVALTYDDAPIRDAPTFDGPSRAAALIAALENVDAGPVAFFVTTRGFEALEDGRDRIETYAAAGHIIANHTHSHPWAHKTAAAEYLADIDRAEALLEGIENRRPWFRYPFLDEGRTAEKRDALVAGLAERELINGYVTIDNYDWYLAAAVNKALRDGKTVDWDATEKMYTDMLVGAAEFYDAAAVEALGRSPAHVLLLHENDLAAMFADDLVDAFRKAGWEIVSPDEAYADPIAQMVPQTLFTMQGRVAALAADAGRSPRTFDFWASDEKRLDAEMAARGLFSTPTGSADGGE